MGAILLQSGVHALDSMLCTILARASGTQCPVFRRLNTYPGLSAFYGILQSQWHTMDVVSGFPMIVSAHHLWAQYGVFQLGPRPLPSWAACAVLFLRPLKAHLRTACSAYCVGTYRHCAAFGCCALMTISSAPTATSDSTTVPS